MNEKTTNVHRILDETDAPQDVKDDVGEILAITWHRIATSPQTPYGEPEKPRQATVDEQREYVKEVMIPEEIRGGKDNIILGLALRVLDIQEERGWKGEA
jgi:hypothetical protein